MRHSSLQTLCPLPSVPSVLKKEQILSAIADVGRELGRTPSVIEFVAHSRISWSAVRRLFPKWNDAVKAAGLQPNTLNAKVEDQALLEDWGQAVRRNRGIPAYSAYRRHGKHGPNTIRKRFGRWSSIPQVFREFAKGKQDWADVMSYLPAPAPKKETGSSILRGKAPHPALKGRATYGHPIAFAGMRREPVDEQGVVLLFGMLAQDLGYMVEHVQRGFPDCEATREIGPERWQRVLIEFEFESRNFRDHGHPLTGCDVIVCWRHNWHDCPKHIEVLELSRVIECLASSKRCHSEGIRRGCPKNLS